MAVDRRAVHGIDWDPGAGAQRRGGLRARLPVPQYVRSGREALGFQRSVQLGRGPQALARAGAAQCRDGRALSGELRQVSGSHVTFSPLSHAGAGPLDSPLFHAGAGPLEERLWSALAEINDPEMPVNLVDLGLIYGLTVDGGRVCVRLTFTAMGCPATEMLMGDIRERLLAEPDLDGVRLEVVWDPPWTSARLTAEGRDALRAWGLAV